MEKAFHRVSYSYLTDALKVLGFGEKFRRWVSEMYDVQHPPRRRVYANGYYSDWFDMKKWVAQGCPLSPLLFLVVAKGLRISYGGFMAWALPPPRGLSRPVRLVVLTRK